MNNQEIKREKHEIDATGQAVGRLASKIAMVLRGKDKPDFSPHIDRGGIVTIINASQVKFTGDKLVQKDYYHHTMYPGGIRRTPMKKIFDNDPGEVIRRAVYGMLPKNRLRDEMMKRLVIKS
ncbi:MAG: 50S ribosomal protein L13 [Candidatus Magasanikbacteria bacterium CG_4_10_14_0_2_um_filter_37_12]|uniref:Large ribosomal subunit protein uL13 n=1 Tax=Candidatus Magasanikbacteria bacterium CG_4_10_14_0_2_um_filter_37_12 TaxID=1974637 RepID=A0A2M7V8Z9_9BACT|nr:MAG: 50S ribosomal protein L13 [Candidatus Magasanikbacteria bacterium CG_4_10_14_0_2_um_filter_37_12]